MMTKKKVSKLILKAVIVAVFSLTLWLFWVNYKVIDVRVVKMTPIKSELKATINGEIVAENAVFLYKKVRMKVKKVFAVPGVRVKKGDLLLTYYGVTKNGYSEPLDSEVREDLNEKIIVLDKSKKDLEGLELEASVLLVQLRDAKKTEEIMNELLAKNRAISAEVIGAKDSVLLINLEYQKTLKDISILEKQIQLKTIVVEKELGERSINTYAPEDGLIVEVNVKEGENIIPAHTLIVFAGQDSRLEVKFKIPRSKIGTIKIGDFVNIRKNFTKKETKETTGVLYKLSEIESTLEDKGKIFDGLIGLIHLDNEELFNIKDEVILDIVGEKKTLKNGISAFSIFDISEDKKKGYIFTVSAGKARKVELELGKKVNHKYEVLQFKNEVLNFGSEAAIIGNPYQLKEGAKVKILKDSKN